VKRSVKRLTVA